MHPRADVLFNVSAAFTGDNRIEALFRHRCAHRGFGGLFHCLDRIGQLEFEQSQILDVPTNKIGQIDQVLVSGQDQLGRNIDRANLADVGRRDLINRPWHCEVGARVECVGIFPANPGHNRLLARLHEVNACCEKPCGSDACEDDRHPALAAGPFGQAEVRSIGAATAAWTFRPATFEDVFNARGTALVVATTR